MKTSEPTLPSYPRSGYDMVTASELVGATPSGAYSWRPPSPPHIHVPQAPEDQKFVLPAYDDTSAQGADRAILKSVTEGDHVSVATRDWKYDWRRKAQPILSFLHLGPSSAARDITYIQTQGITMLLVIRDSRSANARLLSGEKIARQLGIEAAAIDVADYQELIAAFPRAIQTINNHLISEYRKHNPSGLRQGTKSRTPWGKVLVFCESGNERSAEVVAAYLMSMYRLDLIAAIQYIQTRRFCVAFDDSMKNLLLNYQQLLEARRSVAGATLTQTVLNGTNNGISQSKAKRGREEVEINDEGMDLDDADDEARFMGRTTFVPFT
ncbi:Serine/threonine/tyrosine-interacting protein A [Lachnellula hyalina]|uniref:Serine/threonine/tyrosine-interacting protein A n=1 Tax=Lachnellula hyalina TaxID=1316788 RepID=A0A8H8QW84_9HELO|nr:Serine/threonine/tyrosine-interacting protein A [Lachnellula hyalina]TVY23968.1 Serine/threonine/tyrosine-interacting protein A [Lachnellula hyalina]